MPSGETAPSSALRDPAAVERAPRLADLIDLELQLLRDRDAPLEPLHARDAAIAAALAGHALTGRGRVLAWLDALRQRRAAGLDSGDLAGAGELPGARVEELRPLLGAGLSALGFASGVMGIGGWLLSGTGTPINVIVFWPATVGLQLALLLLFGLAALPARALRALPGLSGLHALLRALSGWLPRAVAALWLRGGRERRGLVAQLAPLRRLDWLYGRLRFWLLASLTQGFALAFNLGALAAFALIPAIDDPAFGWRSRLLEPEQVESAARAVALPWRSTWPAAVPGAETVRRTRFSSLESEVGERADPSDPGALDPWAAWWPFLVVSLAVYGLAPRLLLWALARWSVRRALRTAPLDHADVARLRERLERPVLSLGDRVGEGSERSGVARGSAGGERAAPPAGDREELAQRPVCALRWAGVPLDEAALRAGLSGLELRASLGVGALDDPGDANALAALRALGANGAALLAVPAWEPPVGEHLDFLRAARDALGERAPLFVELVHAEGEPGTARAERLAQWRRGLAALGDPWLRVGPWPGAEACG